LHHQHWGRQMRFKSWSPHAMRQDRMGYPVDGWTEGPGLPQSIWRYKWLVAALVLLGMLLGSLFSVTQPVRYEGVVRIFVASEEVPAGNFGRTVMSRAQFIQTPIVLDRVVALTENRLTREELEQRLTVEPAADADFITIRALDTTPENAAGLADAVNLAYRQMLREQRQDATEHTIAELEGVQRRLASELAQIQQQRRTGDSAGLRAEEQAKKRQMDATAKRIEEASADTAGPPPTLQDKAAVPDEPVQPKPLRDGAIGAVVGLVIGFVLAWWLAARRVRPNQVTVESQAHMDEDLEEAIEVLQDLVEHPHADGPPFNVTSDIESTASDIQESAEQVRLADVDHNRMTASVRQALNSLIKDHKALYSLAEWLESQHQDFPQITAERLRDRLPFDQVAVLLKTDEGLDLAGYVGWQPNGVGPVEQYAPSILTKLGGNGARLIGPADSSELLNAGLLGNKAKTIVVAPLEHENVAFGMLIAGKEEPNSEAAQGNGNFDSIGSFARSVAPDLHAWLLLRGLREQLASRGKAQEQTTNRADSEPPSPTDSQPASSIDQQS
jgi:capsular polysaccharide biosynthesis protein